MSNLYPLKFKTIFKEKLWGGQKIKTVLGKDFGNLDNCGETWELSGVKENISQVSNGLYQGKLLSELVATHKADLLGKQIFDQFGDEFPLLIKFIDANQDLSIQVHPDDEIALKNHQSKGKAEMWYIIDSEKDAFLYKGFKENLEEESFLEKTKDGSVIELVHKEKVHKGDVFYLPGGRVHSIGKGLMIAEIQQTSDITYRIYDFDRVDKQGNKRVLHIDQALDAIDFAKPEKIKSDYQNIPNQTNQVVSSPYFTTNKLIIDKSLQLNRSDLDCFKIYIGIGGSGTIAGESIGFGEVMLVPASIKEYQIEPDSKLELLETYIEIG